MVTSGLYASQGMCPGIGLFYVPIVLGFMAHFVQLVPFGQLGENFLGGGSCSQMHVKIQNFIVNGYQNFIDCN